jgi:hypothetical protein
MPYWLIALIAIWIGGLFFLIVRCFSYQIQHLSNLPPGRSAFDREGNLFEAGRYGANGPEFYLRMMRLWWITIAYAAGGILLIVMLSSLVARTPPPG